MHDIHTLLQYVLPEASLQDAVVLLCVDASSPWTVATALNDWSKILANYTRTACSSDERRMALRKCVEKWNRAFDGGDGALDGAAKIHGIDAEDLPLKEGCLVASSSLLELMPDCE